jgi:hypothetical protein
MVRRIFTAMDRKGQGLTTFAIVHKKVIRCK